MKVKIEWFKDGALQGWVVNTVWTAFTMTMLGLGFFMDSVRWGWEKYGGIYATIYLGGMAAWFAYKVAKGIQAGKDAKDANSVPQETVADALKKVTEAMASFKGGGKV